MSKTEPIRVLVDRSSLGAGVVKQLRARTDIAIRREILRRAATVARDSRPPVTRRGKRGQGAPSIVLDRKEKAMATNTGKGYRKGEVRDRSQVRNPATGHWTERDTASGEFTNVKSDRKPFKGVRKER